MVHNNVPISGGVYCKNISNYFELDAIWFAAKKWDHIDKFIILHNTMILLNKLPEFIFTEKFVPFWTANIIDYSPVISIFEKK